MKPIIYKTTNLKQTIFLSLITGIVFPLISPDADQAITNSVNKVQPAIKLYVLDGGFIENIDVTGFGLKREETSASRLPVQCFQTHNFKYSTTLRKMQC